MIVVHQLHVIWLISWLNFQRKRRKKKKGPLGHRRIPKQSCDSCLLLSPFLTFQVDEGRERSEVSNTNSDKDVSPDKVTPTYHKQGLTSPSKSSHSRTSWLSIQSEKCLIYLQKSNLCSRKDVLNIDLSVNRSFIYSKFFPDFLYAYHPSFLPSVSSVLKLLVIFDNTRFCKEKLVDWQDSLIQDRSISIDDVLLP